MASSTLNFDIFARDHASSTFSHFGKTVDRSDHSMSSFRLGIGKLAGAFAGLAIISKVTGFMQDSVAQGRESIKVAAQTDAVLKSTGHSANVYSDAVNELANSISLKTGIDDEAIQSGENLLLTFKNVRNEVGAGNQIFSEATKITTDMSVALGQSLKSSTIQVGKALNDPIKGLTALSRVGVTFSKGQVNLIKHLVTTGHTMHAQKIILGELNSEFAGSAEAQASPAEKAKVAWENFQETIGLKVIPILDKLLIWFTATGLPAIERFGTFLSQKIGPVWDQLIHGSHDSGSALSLLGTYLQSAKSSFMALYAAAKPIITDIVNGIKKNWPQISATIRTTMQQVASTIRSIAALITTLWNTFGRTLMTYARQSWQNISQIIRGALNVIQGVVRTFTALLRGDWSGVWAGLKQIASGALGIIKGLVKQSLAQVITEVRLIGDGLRAAFGNAWESAKNATQRGVQAVVSFVTGLPGRIVGAIGDLSSVLYNAGTQVISGLVNGIQDKVRDLVSTLKNVTSMIPNLKGPIEKDRKLLRPAGNAIMDGLIFGLKERERSLTHQLAAITKQIESAGQRLSSLMSSRSQYTSGFQSSFATSVFGNEFATDPKRILIAQRSARNDARKLSHEMRKLVHMGLSNDLLQQLAAAGPAGRAQIDALAHSSGHTVRQFNRLNAQTQRALAAGGRVAGNEIYGDRIKDTRSVLQRRRDQRSDIRQALHGVTLHLKGATDRKAKILARESGGHG